MTNASCSSRTSQTGPTVLPVGSHIGEFTVQALIGEGGYGQIYQVVESDTDQLWAMKIEHYNAPKQGMETEISVFTQIGRSPLFPSFLAVGDAHSFRYFVMELLGPSISSLRRALKSRKYSKYTLLHIGYHSLRAIETFHGRGFVHCDIKPGNFLVRPDRRNPVVLIDFGLSRPYRGPDGAHLPPRDFPGYTGTVKYASIHAHDQIELSRRDDLISWFYSMIECATGHTPWPGVENQKAAAKIKRQISTRRLCSGLPSEFERIWEMIRGLEYADTPDYHGIRQLIVQALARTRGHNHKYDWEAMKKVVIAGLTSLSLNMGGPLGSDSIARTDGPGEEEEGGGGCGCAVQ
jgi:serine/threonine protein kinase